MTYSIVARDPSTGQLGVAVQSHYFSVGSVVTWAEAGVGAIATQSFANIDFGPEGLALLRAGHAAGEVLDLLIAADEQPTVRQLGIVDGTGQAAAYTGSACVAFSGHLVGDGFAVQANMMANPAVWPAMFEGYRLASGDLPDRLVATLEAAQAAGGDVRGQQSAALLVVSGERLAKPWAGKLFELRVEDHPEPIAELKRLLRYARAYRGLAQASGDLARGRFVEAAEMMRGVVDLVPEVAELKLWTGAACLGAGDSEAATVWCRQAVEMDPQLAEYLRRLVGGGLVPDDPEVLARIYAAPQA